MKLPPDFNDLLAEFARAGVDCALVGGYAVAFHGRPRATKDIDLLLGGTPENLARAAAALTHFGAPSHVVEAVRAMAPKDIVFLGNPPLRIDLLCEVDGIDAARVLQNAVAVDVDGVPLRVISLDDLIVNKRAAGRPQDLMDVEYLERVRANAPR